MANIQPLGQRVLLKRVETETVSAGGIVLVDSAQEKPQEALVVTLGTGGRNEDGSAFEFAVSVNDKVLISKYGGTEVKSEGDDYLIMNEADILGIIG
ncbi:co-chaperone GroES [Rubritalea marina]|uniref:co-chaperone GroES n=1 Tax=Rubritalea marina TaxID=361055 RepID=UPI00036AF74D|nr:co-chaperone GroES [Rubritalea marina]